MKEAVIDISGLRPLLAAPRRVIVRGLVGVVAAIVVAVMLSLALYQVQPDEIAVVQRFGRYVRVGAPGLRVRWPFIESVSKVPVQRQLRQEFGFRSAGATAAVTRVAAESTMLTGDLNVAVVEWVVQYRIANPYDYLFHVRDVGTVFRDLTQAIMQQMVGDRTLTEVVTLGRHDIEVAVQQQLQQATDRYGMGIRVDQVVLQDVNPPDPVKPSWDDVTRAQQERDALISRARAEYNNVIPRARGEAAQAILAGDGYTLDRVNRAQGDAARFEQLYTEYRKAPDVTRRRLQLETMSRMLPTIGSKIVIDKDAKGVLPLLPLNSLAQGGAATVSGAAAAAAVTATSGKGAQ
jgi:membrane protease subunit HflK